MSSLPKKPLSPSVSAASAVPADNSADTTNSTVSEAAAVVPDSSDDTDSTHKANSAQALELKRPVMRPVRPPQPDPAPATEKPVQKGAESVAPAVEKSPVVVAETPSETQDSTSSRFQPIPPPSEPKQYRAIGLVRGRYTPSEEQFTRGEMAIADGATIEAVLLGRVMSLVKNHLDLTQEHLWVVYPRTRNLQKELHLQIVGVWEPEKLQKELIQSDVTPDASEAAKTDKLVAGQAPEIVKAIPSIAEDTTENLTPGYDDDYFSIRGEVIGAYPDEGDVVIRIQQSPRKSTEQAKAFKLHLKGSLPSDKAQGYFWELHVRRQQTALVITDGKVIGMVPPRKRTEQGGRPPRRGGGKPFAKRFEGGGKPRTSTPPPNRPPLPKPLKRSEPSSES
jgi:hypothetical protein